LKALLVAPDETSGLQPVASVTPAPLIPLLGAPLIFPLLQRLADSGIRDVLLTCPSRSASYARTLLDGRPWKLNLAILELDEASTAMSLEWAQAHGFHDETLAVLPANAWTNADWRLLEALHQDAGGGLSRFSAEGAPTEIILADPGVSLSSSPWRTLDSEFRWRPVNAWDEFWTLAKESLESPRNQVAPRYPQLGQQLRLAPLAHIDRAGVDHEGPVWLGPGAIVHAGATLRGPVWIGANCRVGPGVRLESCMLESAASLHGPLTLTHALVIANRAIDMIQGGVAVLEDRTAGLERSPDPGMTMGLLQLATRTARREASTLKTAR
jgi:NDP-sugar pyrophosphorylase family protein